MAQLLASVFLRRFALPVATRTNQQLCAVSTIGVQSLSSSCSVSDKRVSDVNRRGVATISAGDALARLASDHPHQEVVRYEHKNVKWTLKHVNYYSDALATGMVDTGLQPGDVVLSWLPMHFAEQHILQFACSKAGFLLFNLDPNPDMAKSNPEASMNALAKALELTKANVVITQEAGNDVNYIDLTTGVIPEIRIFDFSDGKPFITPRYPHLRFAAHTGYSIVGKEGMYLFKHFLVPSNNLESRLRDTGCKALDGETPLLGELILDNDGIPMKIGKAMTNEEVFNNQRWPVLSSILNRQYMEIPGVGVVF